MQFHEFFSSNVNLLTSIIGLKKRYFLAYLGMQLGGVRSTSQVAKSFIGTGLKDDPEADVVPKILWPPIPDPGPDPEAIVEAAGAVTTPVDMVAVWLKPGPPEPEPPGGRNPPLLTKLAIQKISLFWGWIPHVYFFLRLVLISRKKFNVLTADSLLGTNSSLELRPRPRFQSLTHNTVELARLQTSAMKWDVLGVLLEVAAKSRPRIIEQCLRTKSATYSTEDELHTIGCCCCRGGNVASCFDFKNANFSQKTPIWAPII